MHEGCYGQSDGSSAAPADVLIDEAPLPPEISLPRRKVAFFLWQYFSDISGFMLAKFSHIYVMSKAAMKPQTRLRIVETPIIMAISFESCHDASYGKLVNERRRPSLFTRDEWGRARGSTSLPLQSRSLLELQRRDLPRFHVSTCHGRSETESEIGSAFVSTYRRTSPARVLVSALDNFVRGSARYFWLFDWYRMSMLSRAQSSGLCTVL